MLYHGVCIFVSRHPEFTAAFEIYASDDRFPIAGLHDLLLQVNGYLQPTAKIQLTAQAVSRSTIAVDFHDYDDEDDDVFELHNSKWDY